MHSLWARVPLCEQGMLTLCYMANQVYIIGGDGTQKGASVIFEVIFIL